MDSTNKYDKYFENATTCEKAWTIYAAIYYDSMPTWEVDELDEAWSRCAKRLREIMDNKMKQGILD